MAAAQSTEATQSAARAQERYYSSYGEPQPIDTGAPRGSAGACLFYGEPEPLTLPRRAFRRHAVAALALSITVGLADRGG